MQSCWTQVCWKLVFDSHDVPCLVVESDFYTIPKVFEASLLLNLRFLLEPFLLTQNRFFQDSQLQCACFGPLRNEVNMYKWSITKCYKVTKTFQNPLETNLIRSRTWKFELVWISATSHVGISGYPRMILSFSTHLVSYTFLIRLHEPSPMTSQKWLGFLSLEKMMVDSR